MRVICTRDTLARAVVSVTSACASSPNAFAGLNSLQRHRLVYEALGEMMHQDIHALGIEAYAPTRNGARRTG